MFTCWASVHSAGMLFFNPDYHLGTHTNSSTCYTTGLRSTGKKKRCLLSGNHRTVVHIPDEYTQAKHRLKDRKTKEARSRAVVPHSPFLKSIKRMELIFPLRGILQHEPMGVTGMCFLRKPVVDKFWKQTHCPAVIGEWGSLVTIPVRQNVWNSIVSTWLH